MEKIKGIGLMETEAPWKSLTIKKHRRYDVIENNFLSLVVTPFSWGLGFEIGLVYSWGADITIGPIYISLEF